MRSSLYSNMRPVSGHKRKETEIVKSKPILVFGFGEKVFKFFWGGAFSVSGENLKMDCSTEVYIRPL